MSSRIDYLDAARAFALLLGIVFHASLSFTPFFIGWAVMDVSTSPLIPVFVMISHSFRMELFFLLAGFFGCQAVRRHGVRAVLLSRAVRLGLPFVLGWFLLRPLIVSGWVMGGASLHGDYAFWSSVLAGIRSLAKLPEGLLTGTHLWFLYYLALITLAALVTRAALGSVIRPLLPRADALVGWLTRSPWGLLLLAVPTAAVLRFMRGWGMDTPDQTLIPSIPVFLVYAGCFGFGWMLARHPETLSQLARLTWDRWLWLTVGLASTLLLGRVGLDAGHPQRTAAHLGFVVGYACLMWSLVALTLGAARRWFSRPRAWVRYLADSSYWMYLIHLPIVVWLQVVVAEWPIHWLPKLGLISLLTGAVGLVTYHGFVRATVVGRVLHGRRQGGERRSLTGLAKPMVVGP